MSESKKTPFHGVGEFLAKNKVWTNFLYGSGASVVLIGALFKILHLPGAAQMLSIGMCTEAFLFLMSAFELPHKEYNWSLVYPELANKNDEDEFGEKNVKRVEVNNSSSNAGLSALSNLGQAEITSDEITKLTDGLKKMGDLAENLNSLDGISEANKHLVDRLQAASQAVHNFEQSHTQASAAISEGASNLASSYSNIVKSFESDFAQVSKDTKEYGEHLSVMSGKLSSINAVYELQLKSVNEQLQHMENLGQSVTKMNDAFAGSIPDANAYRLGAERLKSQIENLNSVYGNMLNALTSNV